MIHARYSILVVVLYQLVIFSSSSTSTLDSYEHETSCYDETGQSVYCQPAFINVAFDHPVHVTNTCGSQPSDYCIQTNFQYENGEQRHEKCDVCDESDPVKAHPAKFLTDTNHENNLTWWQSDTMELDIHEQHSVNLTLNLGI